MSSMNLGSILIFASCVVGTCNITLWVFFSLDRRGPTVILRSNISIFFLSTIMVGVGIFTLGGDSYRRKKVYQVHEISRLCEGTGGSLTRVIPSHGKWWPKK